MRNEITYPPCITIKRILLLVVSCNLASQYPICEYWFFCIDTVYICSLTPATYLRPTLVALFYDDHCILLSYNCHSIAYTVAVSCSTVNLNVHFAVSPYNLQFSMTSCNCTSNWVIKVNFLPPRREHSVHINIYCCNYLFLTS